jgi:hypothetical protein
MGTKQRKLGARTIYELPNIAIEKSKIYTECTGELSFQFTTVKEGKIKRYNRRVLYGQYGAYIQMFDKRYYLKLDTDWSDSHGTNKAG